MSYITLECPFTQGNGMYRVEFDYTVSDSSSSYTVRLNRFSLYVNDYDSEDDDSRVSISVSLTSNGTSIFSGSQTHVEWWGTRWYPAGANAHKTFDKSEYSQNVSLQFTASAKGHTGRYNCNVTISPLADSLLTPNQVPTGLGITRKGNVFTGSWKVPSGATSSSAKNKFSGIQAWWNLDMRSVGDIADNDWLAASTTSNDQTYDEFKGNFSPWTNRALSRSAFYPYTSQAVNRVQCAVRGYHTRANNGKALYGPWTGTANYTFELPQRPTVEWSYDKSSIRATVTVKTEADKDAYERADTMIKIAVRKVDGKDDVIMNWSATTSTEWKKTVDLSSYIGSLSAGQGVTIRCWAYARGIRGDNPSASNAVYAEKSVALPGPATIKKITCDKKSASGIIRIEITPGKFTGTVQLQRRKGESGSWATISGAEDNGDCKALYDAYGDVEPKKGEYTYYRIRSASDNFVVYSEPKRADCIFTAKPPLVCNATVGIVSAVQAPTGTSVELVMGFTDATPNTGCELSWSDLESAWNSTSKPQTAQFTGEDAQSKSPLYAKTRTVTVTGLTSGTTYYAKMRRYREHEEYDEPAYSAYSTLFTFRGESAEDDTCAVFEVKPGEDGTTAEFVIGINEDNTNTGTEITWSTDDNAWYSNEQPSSMSATWPAYPSTGDWTKHQKSYLRGLNPGTTYFMKARRYFSAGSSTTYSPYSPLASFTTLSPKHSLDVRCGIVSVEGGEDGKSAEVVIGWDGNHTGCEISWSDDPDAWTSNVQPESQTFTWDDDESKSVAWSHTSTFQLHGLEEGVTYYIKARSYYDTGDDTAWSEYTEPVEVTPVSAPSAVILSAPYAVPRGESIEVYWTVGSELPQTEWHIHAVGEPQKSIAEGTGSLCRASILPERYGDAESISFYVSAGCGGGLTDSEPVTVGIADEPSCESSCSPTLTVQPASFEVYTDNPQSRLLATCFSMGATMEGPDGSRDQLEGDVVWTDSLAPSWSEVDWDETARYADLQDEVADTLEAYEAALESDDFTATEDTEVDPAKTYYAEESGSRVEVTPDDEDPSAEGWLEGGESVQSARAAYKDAEAALESHSGTTYAATISLPTTVNLIDNGLYALSMQTVELVAGLRSETSSCQFKVAWEHQAPAPSDSISVTVDEAARSARITLAAP